MTTATIAQTKRHFTKLAAATAACGLASVFALPANASLIKFEFVSDSYELIVEEPSFESWLYPERKVTFSFVMDTQRINDFNTFSSGGSIHGFSFGSGVTDAQLNIEGVGSFKNQNTSASFESLDVSGSDFWENYLNVGLGSDWFGISQWIHTGAVPDDQFDSLAQGIIDYYSDSEGGLWAFRTSEGLYTGAFERNDFTITQVPEPFSVALIAIGLAGISARRINRKSSSI